MKAIFWFIGEVENEEWISKKDDGDEKISTALKTEDVLGKFILLVFIFLFVIVLMNLLNAIAIGDIQVCTVPYDRRWKFELFSKLPVLKLNILVK